MKKPLLLIVSTLILNQAAAQNPVLNPSFETWSLGEPGYWLTNNNQATTPMVTQDADAHSGTSAVRGEVISYMGTPLAPVLYSAPNGGQSGFPMTVAYTNLDFYYKFFPVNSGDQLYAYMNIQNSVGGGIANGYMGLGTPTTVYALASVPVNYVGTNPTNLELSFSVISTGGPNPGVGTWFEIDDMEMNYGTGVNELSRTGLKTPYPNPAAEHVNIPFHVSEPTEITIRIADMQGRIVKEVLPSTHVFTDGKVIADVADLEAGIYQCILTDGVNSSSSLIMVD